MPLVLIFSVSFALLVDEIMLSAIFHVLLGAGNTVAAIAIALVGLSASGVAAYLIPAFRRPQQSSSLAQATAFAFGTTLMASAFLIMALPVSHGDFVYARGELAVRLYRLAIYHLAVIPFFLGGLTINLLFRSHAARISRLYFADLAGAAFGCAASPLLLSALGASRAIVYGALPVVLLSSLLARGESRLRRALVLVPIVFLAADFARPAFHSFATLNTMGEVHAPRYRSFRIGPGDIEFEKWALDAWTIIRDERIPQQWENFRGWGLSPRYSGPVPRTKLVNYNARFSTYVTEFDGDFAPLAAWLDADLGSLHHQLGRRFDRVLNIGAGGGREVLSALQHGAKHVVAVDVSEVVVDDIMKSYLRDFSGELYLDPRVRAVADEGRTFAERTDESFDLVDFSIVGGMNLEKMDLVRIEDLFTVEAIRTYLSRLSEDGVFSYLMYTTRSEILAETLAGDGRGAQPYVPALRTLTGLRGAFDEIWPGRRFGDHVLIAGLHGVISPRYDLVHIIVSRAPFTDAERARFLELCRELEFLAFHPRGADQDATLYSSVADSDDLAASMAELPFSIRSATDDRPFQYFVEGQQLRDALLRGDLLTLLAGNPMLSLALRIGLLALVVTAIPLAVIVLRRQGHGSRLRDVWPMLLFFACIGFGYMAVEISVLLKLQFYLGKPIYGLSVALFAFLLASGVGSNATHRIPEARLVPGIYAIVVAVLVAGLLFFALSPGLFSATLGLPLAARIPIAVASVFPLAFPMGMLFPIGVKLISRESADWIPWAWAINGCLSVLGIFGARVTALFLGFSRALLVGLLVYGLVAACIALWTRVRVEAHRTP